MKKAATPAEMTASTQGNLSSNGPSNNKLPEMQDCPQFLHCSAPLCPLDPYRAIRSYLPSEPVCFYMRERIKPGGQARLERAIGPTFASEVWEACRDVKSAHGPLWKRLKRSKCTRSRLEVLPCDT
jgi:hypothetical protein